MRKALSILLIIAMVASCFITLRVAAQTEVEYVGKKFTLSKAVAREDIIGKANISGLEDGTHTVTYTVYNTNDFEINGRMYFMTSGWAKYNSGDGNQITAIPANGSADITAQFTVSEGKITGNTSTTEQSDAMIRMDFLVLSGTMPIGTEIIVKYNQVNDKMASGLGGFAGASTKEEITSLPGSATPTPEPTPEPTSEYVGKKITFTTDVQSIYARNDSAGISGLDDGEHSIRYLVYNNGAVDLVVSMSLQNGWGFYEQNYGTPVTVPAYEARYTTYNFTVKDGLITGSVSSSKQEDATLRFNVEMSSSSSNGLNMIPAGTEIIFKYNKLDGTDCARNLDDAVASTLASEVKELPILGKKITTHTAAENTFWYMRSNAEIKSFEDGTHTVGYYVYNPNSFSVSVGFYLQNGFTTVNNNTGTAKIIGAYERAYLSYTYTVADGKYYDAVATEMTIRFDVRPTEASLPADTSIYVQYMDAPDRDPLKNIQSTRVVDIVTSYTVSDMVFCPDYKPTGVIYTAGMTAANPYFVTGTSGGLFTDADIVDGNLVFEQYMYNENDFDIHFMPAFHTVITSGSWAGHYAGKLMTVEKHSGAWIKASVAVNEDNTITVEGTDYPIENFFLRLYFSCEISQGTRFIITTDSERIENMLSVSTGAKFTAVSTYDTAYGNPPSPDGTVDPAFHISTAFGSHMVLQRDKEVSVWGVSSYIGETVTVTFGGQTKTATVPSDGKWLVTLDSMPANKAPQELTAICNGKTQTLTDILVGDVFVIGGQSNADMALSSCGVGGNQYSNEYKEQLIASAEGNIRFFRQGKMDAMAQKETMNTPQYEPINGNVWTRENLSTANTFCAFGFFFGHKLYDALDVPIGMIMAASAGSPLSQLMSKEAAEETGYDRYESGIPVSGMYNALMAPFINMSFKGMLFYQGESEHGLALSDYGKYNEYLNAYVEDLREKNGSNFAFYYAQVGTYPGLGFTGIAEQRAVMLDGLDVINNSGMIVTMDMGARADYHDTAHSPYKEPIGERFANLALTKLYGIGEAEYVLSPEPISAVKTQDGILVTFKQVGDGLKRIGQHETLSGFRVMTGARAYTAVEATIVSKNQVLLASNGIDGIIGVAYGIEHLAFADYPEGNGDLKYVANLGNSEGLPTPTFKMELGADIVGAQTNVGKDLTLNFHTSAQGQLVIKHEGIQSTVDGVYNASTGTYEYMYEGINPQCIGDKITAELYVDGVKVDERVDYSIMEYCNNIYTGGKPEGYTDEKYDALLSLLADMLDYGAAAQEHMNYNEENPVNTYDWVEEYRTEFTKPESIRDITETTNNAYSFKSAGLHVDNYVSIYVKFNVTDWTNVNVKIGDKTYTQADLTGDTLYLEDLTATEYDKEYVMELQVEGVTVQTLTYSANSYIASKCDGTQSTIVQAIGRYGASAEKLVATE